MRTIFSFISCFFLLTIAKPLAAQYIDSTEVDTLLHKQLRPVKVTDSKKTRTAEEEAAYQKMRRKVIKLYPYALMAKQIYADIESNLSSADSRKEKRNYKSEKEKELRDRFEEEIKNLYTSDGPILTRLIYRETGHTCYDLVKELKGGLKAMVYQMSANHYGYTLKQTYDPLVDYEIEGVVQSMQSEVPNANPTPAVAPPTENK